MPFSAVVNELSAALVGDGAAVGAPEPLLPAPRESGVERRSSNVESLVVGVCTATE